MPGCQSLNRSTRDAEVGFERRTFRQRVCVLTTELFRDRARQQNAVVTMSAVVHVFYNPSVRSFQIINRLIERRKDSLGKSFPGIPARVFRNGPLQLHQVPGLLESGCAPAHWSKKDEPDFVSQTSCLSTDVGGSTDVTDSVEQTALGTIEVSDPTSSQRKLRRRCVQASPAVPRLSALAKPTKFPVRSTRRGSITSKP
ncbi:hypothetical protein CSKR_114163 [Clonorchis sinensis]|uniref:Uncharacterized protein n=1 Tax=Clonorchis sinensis TaxID=79923 RepID=A0A419Q9K0_CLOSI|nr:hypothetical protein CSKR_114163 [Clonorchis sinensis]